MTKTEAQRIAQAINALRPDWPTTSLLTFIAANLRERAYRDVAAALAWVAADETTTTPGRVLSAGPWWSSNGSDVPLPPSSRDTTCATHLQRIPCPGCAADRLSGTATVDAPPTSDLARCVAEARAVLRGAA